MRATEVRSFAGPELALERARRGITQAALSRALGVSRQRVVGLERQVAVSETAALRLLRALDAISASGELATR